jgi:hypothetical protein
VPADAASAAAAGTGDVPDGQVPFAIRYGTFTDTHHFTTDSQGQRIYDLQNRKVWIVRYANVTVPLLAKAGTFTGDYNVVVDANTGAYIGAFMAQ